MDKPQPATGNINVSDESEVYQSLNEVTPGERSAPRLEPEVKVKKTKGTPTTADRLPGKSLLPLARIQKILKADKELPSCNKEAVFLISVATEEFIKRLGQASQQQAGREKRTTVQRKDVVTAVRRADEFLFLEEILSTGIPALPPAPAKRKVKANSSTTATTSMTIKDAFGRGKAEPAAVSDEEDGRRSQSADHPQAVTSRTGQNGSQQEGGDTMDVS